jgi:adenylylsulfate kinase
VGPKTQDAFAVWVTDLPASGKSTIVAALTAQLTARGVDVAVLESDALRQILTPRPHYDEDERDTFYRQMVYLGALLTRHGVPVIFDATANRHIYRDRAQQQISKFLEVYVDCPLETCMARDSKGIYRKAREGAANTVPGLQAAYEPPERRTSLCAETGRNPKLPPSESLPSWWIEATWKMTAQIL